MKNEKFNSKTILRRNKNKSKKRIKFDTKIINNYNLKFGDVYQRIHYLLNLACELFKQNKYLSKIYISIMKDIIKKNALRTDSKFKKLICSKCYNMIFLDENTKIELKNVSGKKVLFMTCTCGEEKQRIIF